MTNVKQHQNRFGWLVTVSLVFIGIVFGSRYAKFPLALVGRTLESMPLKSWLSRLLHRPVIGFYVSLYPIDLLFTSLPVYLALSVTGLALVVAALVLARPGKLGRAVLLLGFLAVLALPFVTRYKPAVVVNPDRVQINVPTRPGPLNGVVKAMQVGAEVRRCGYKLLGWSEQDALYGEEICGMRHRFWVYWPISDRRLQTVSTIPTNFFQQEVSREQLLAAGIHSAVPQDEALRIVVREPGLASPEGWWYAFVARHVYGPEDVVIITR